MASQVSSISQANATMTTHTTATTATATKRAPLSNNPNAINSPFQMAGSTTSTKRSRSQSGQKDVPPPKKQAVDINPAILRTPVRRSRAEFGASGGGENAAAKATNPSKKAPVRSTRPAATASPLFADVAGRGRKVVQEIPPAIERTERARKPSKAVVQQISQAPGADQQTLDVRAWQKHYRKAFPGYVFFFESIPQDVLLKAQKQISNLGAVSAPSCLDGVGSQFSDERR